MVTQRPFLQNYLKIVQPVWEKKYFRVFFVWLPWKPKLFENRPTSLGEEELWSIFRLVAIAMEIRIMHGSQIFEGILIRSLRGCFL